MGSCGVSSSGSRVSAVVNTSDLFYAACWTCKRIGECNTWTLLREPFMRLHANSCSQLLVILMHADIRLSSFTVKQWEFMIVLGGYFFTELILKGIEVKEHRRSNVNYSKILMRVELCNSLIFCIDIAEVTFIIHEIKASITSILCMAFDKEVEFDSVEEAAFS